MRERTKTKDMPKLAVIKRQLPIAASLSGVALSLMAWAVSLSFSYKESLGLYLSDIAVWVGAALTLVLYVHKRAPDKLTDRYGTVLALGIATIIPNFRNGHFLAFTAQTVAFIGLLLLLLGLNRWRAVHPLLGRIGRLLKRSERIPSKHFILIACAVFLASTLTISYCCYHLLPVYTDTMAQYIHAKFVAAGYLYYYPSHPLKEFFPVWLMVNDGKWYSQYPPMHQTLMGLFILLHASWLLNPLEGTITLAAIYAITRRAYGDNLARLTAILFLLSPFVLFLFGEYMNHASALMFATLLFYSYTEMLAAKDRRSVLRWALAAGVSAGCGFLARPLTSIGVGAPFALHALYTLYKQRSAFIKPILMLLAGFIPGVLFQLWYNYETTGEFLTYAYTRYHANSLGRAMGYFKDSSIPFTLDKMHGEWTGLNIAMYEWSLPIVVFVVFACLHPLRHRTGKFALAVILSQTFFNMFNQFTSTIFGPRYLFETSACVAMLIALGVTRLPALMAGIGLAMPRRDARRGMVAVALITVCLAGFGHFPQKFQLYSHYMDSHPEFYARMMNVSAKPALIFLSPPDPHPASIRPHDVLAKFRWTVWTNPPQDDAPMIFAVDLGEPKDRALMQFYPNRRAYREGKGKLIEIPANPPPAEPQKPTP